MNVFAALASVGRELLALVVDDGTTFAAVVVGLVATYLLAHHAGRSWPGFVLLGVVWLGLGLSLARAARRR